MLRSFGLHVLLFSAGLYEVDEMRFVKIVKVAIVYLFFNSMNPSLM